jgi:hypothetical protein
MLKEAGGQQGLLQGVERPGEGVVVEVKQQQVGLRGLRAQDHGRNRFPPQMEGGPQALPARDGLQAAALQSLHPGRGQQAHRGHGLLQTGHLLAFDDGEWVGGKRHPGQGNLPEKEGSTH